MDRFRRIAPTVWVAGQVSFDDIAAAAAAGVTRVVNNRPDDEDPGQPTSTRIEQSVRSAGMDYVHIPVVGFPAAQQVEAVAVALADDAPTLLYCRSGMRSAAAWALATAASGARSPDQIREAAAAAGFDLARLPL
jgi:uncharacterized protein (TIGR01244 family)